MAAVHVLPAWPTRRYPPQYLKRSGFMSVPLYYYDMRCLSIDHNLKIATLPALPAFALEDQKDGSADEQRREHTHAGRDGPDRQAVGTLDLAPRADHDLRTDR